MPKGSKAIAKKPFRRRYSPWVDRAARSGHSITDLSEKAQRLTSELVESFVRRRGQAAYGIATPLPMNLRIHIEEAKFGEFMESLSSAHLVAARRLLGSKWSSSSENSKEFDYSAFALSWVEFSGEVMMIWDVANPKTLFKSKGSKYKKK